MFSYNFTRPAKKRVVFQKRMSLLLLITVATTLFLLNRKELLNDYFFIFGELFILLLLPFNERTDVNLRNRLIVQSINFFHIELYNKWIIPMNDVILRVEKNEEKQLPETNEIKAVELSGLKTYSIGRINSESLSALEQELFESAA